MSESTDRSQQLASALVSNYAERELATARAIAECRVAYQPQRLPPRPADLPHDNIELIDIVERLQRGEESGKSQQRVGHLFGSWRAAVWRLEDLNAQHAALLVEALRTLDAAAEATLADGVVASLQLFGAIDWSQAPKPEPGAHKMTSFRRLKLYAASVLRDTSLMPKQLREAGVKYR